jgi:hypothetical protein
MPKIKYRDQKFSASSLGLIEKANEIISEYEGQGFQLTLRQLYYQFVARDLIPNNLKSYKALGSVINDARLAGLIDWYHITDRTRGLAGNAHWATPGERINSAARTHRIDLWERQPLRPEVWIEKDALVGVIEGVCSELDVNFLSCRGYTSQSEMWAGGRRLVRYMEKLVTDSSGGEYAQRPVIFHFGDHDPSGKDMTRDIVDRLELFTGGVKLERLALNMDQIRQYNPPPNPAKITDSRAAAYIAEFGNDSWELDALEPKVITGLIRTNVEALIDRELWNEDVKRQEEERALLMKTGKHWPAVVKFLSRKQG